MLSAQSARRDASTSTNLSGTCTIADDILIEIFIDMVRDEALNYDLDAGCKSLSTGPARYPWTLAAVCRRWREMTLQNSALWSYVDLTGHRCPESSWYRGSAHDVGTPHPDLHHFRVHLQLERSRHAPLVICADLLCNCDTQVADWRAALSHSERWQELRVNVSGAVHLHDVIPDHTSFSSLKKLRCIDESDDSYPWTAFPDKCGSTFLNLRSITLSSIQWLPQRRVAYPWHQLTSLTLHDYQGQNFISLLLTLSQCKSLRRFSFSLSNTRSGRLLSVDDIQKVIPMYSITIPRLTSLAFMHSIYSTDKTLLPFLKLPSLRHLNFGSITANLNDNWAPPDDSEGSSEILFDLIRDSGCSLAELSLSVERGPLSLGSVFEMMPRLQLLHLNIAKYPAIPQSLIFQGTSHPCPALEQLWITCGHSYSAEIESIAESIVEVVTSRLQSPGTSYLKVLRIAVYEDASKAILQADLEAKLEEYVHHGLKLQIFTRCYQNYALEFRDLPRIY